MSLLWYIGAFLLALAPLIVVHEFGHYLVARWCGVKVLRFSIGFGRPLYIWQSGKNGTEWALAAIPFGGYVKMLDEREAPVPPELRHRAFNRQSVAKRMAIVAAGPVMNLLLAVVIYCGIFMTGVTDLKPYLGTPAAGSLAAQAGVQSGDRVTALNGKPVTTWTDLRKELLDAVLDREGFDLAVVTADGRSALRPLQAMAMPQEDFEQDIAEMIGLVPLQPRIDPVVGVVAADSPAQRAGIRVGDVVSAIDGAAISDWDQVVATVRRAQGRRLVVDVKRGGEPLRFEMIPERVEENGKHVERLGIGVKPDEDRYAPFTIEVRYGFEDAAGRAMREVRDTALLSLRMIGRMVIGQASLRNLSGPVTIADYAGQSAKLGISSFMRFIALISISIGVLNLLPVPVLDGGHLMYYLAELFKGSPVSDRALEVGQKIGFGILGFLMLFALFNDIHRLIPG